MYVSSRGPGLSWRGRWDSRASAPVPGPMPEFSCLSDRGGLSLQIAGGFMFLYFSNTTNFQMGVGWWRLFLKHINQLHFTVM